MTKTIFTLATPDSVSAIGVIRISGPKTFHALSIICDCDLSSFETKLSDKLSLKNNLILLIKVKFNYEKF